ncbi:hypothetical protein BFP97_05545 [Roseivirga sp. 4D4]|uniref:universal stress protein n=1 Tax=Roseivirga sp. 4D4 TaxID=1889784 RepID=UPI000853A255|nr:universal stress protein [Roseivirga sp. 4D4]OEK01007.1 hypothetical protein BFP97_05545 [Roseivirga sp. 4D4]
MAIDRIIIPTDFSTCADRALELALSMATKDLSELIICHINPVAAGGDAMFFINAEILDRTEKEVDQSFRELLDKFPKLKQVSHKFVQTTGFSVDKIRDVAEEEMADLMIMGTKGRNNRIGEFFGSVASGIMKRSDIPILIVPENAQVESIKSILLALDFEDEHQQEGTKVLNAIATTLQSELHIVNVIKDLAPSEVSLNQAQMSHYDAELPHIDHHYHFVNDDDIEHGITQYALENEIQMIALIGRSYRFIDRLFHKSLSKKLSYHTTLPLLVLPK